MPILITGTTTLIPLKRAVPLGLKLCGHISSSLCSVISFLRRLQSPDHLMANLEPLTQQLMSTLSVALSDVATRRRSVPVAVTTHFLRVVHKYDLIAAITTLR